MFQGYDGPIRPQDFRVIYQTLSSSPKGISALIEFLATKIDRIVKEVNNGDQVATSIYSVLASSVALDDEILQVCIRKYFFRVKNAYKYNKIQIHKNYFICSKKIHILKQSYHIQ